MKEEEREGAFSEQSYMNNILLIFRQISSSFVHLCLLYLIIELIL